MSSPGARVIGIGRHLAPGAPAPPPGRRQGIRKVVAATLRSRLLHFLVIGGVLFALSPGDDPGRDIAFSSTTFIALEQAQAERLGAPVLPGDETGAVRTRAIEDEILYREALRLGFDKNDNVVRQRLIQKVLFLAEDLAGVSRAPSEDQLRAFYQATQDQWTRPARVHLIHVYAGADRRDHLAGLRARAVAATAEAPGVPPSLGEAFPLPRTVQGSPEDLVAQYGPAFAAAVFGLPQGEWSEPVPSKHGWHLVQVLERRDAGPATFDDVRGRLPIAFLVARKKQAVAEFLRRAASRYRITVDGEPVSNLTPSRRAVAERDPEPD